MKVVAINSSPKMNKGNTALILNPFLEGMSADGADVELFYTRKLTINPCNGCVACWYKTPGECSQKDDMKSLLSSIREAEIIVFASPVYVDSVNGPMKNLMDRMMPLGKPLLEIRNGRTRHFYDEEHDPKAFVLVSSCGFWEMDTFDPLVVHMQALSTNFGWKFAGALLRPHAEFLKPMMKSGVSMDGILQGAKAAGRELVTDGTLSTETLGMVSRELVDQESFVERINNAYCQALDSHKGK